MRNLVLGAVLLMSSVFGLTAHAAVDVSDSDSKSKQYTEVSPVPVAEPGKIEVIEFFWYGCPHCYAFEPKINPWIDKLPADVNFRRVPAAFGGPWSAHAQLFITLDLMDVEKKVHSAVFDAIQNKGLKLLNITDAADFVATQGVDKDKFSAMYKSFAVTGMLEKDKALAEAYGIQGVPTLIVNGKYKFDIGSAGGEEQALELADKLIAKERAAK